jgi:histidinol-phosphate/aromatic aminotransferase/cobyric acid decarboxylase-like protein
MLMLRCNKGCIVSQQNPHLITALSHLCAQPPSFATLNLISLLNWAQLPTLFALKMERLTQSYNILAAAFRRHDVCFIKPTHGIFVLAKLTKEARTEEDERRFYEELAKRGVRVAYGTEHRGVQNDFGWCRIRYGVSVEVVSRAVQIIERFLEKRQ